MKQPGTRELFAYWNTIRRGRSAPERADIDPGAVRNVLADTFILEIDAARALPFQLAGTRVNALFAAEMRGRSFVDLWQLHARRNIVALIFTVLDGACPVVAGVSAAPEDPAGPDLEMLLLPLRHNGKTHARVLGALMPVHRPAWLGHAAAGRLDLGSIRMIQEDERAGLPFAARRGSGEQRGHLMVYEGGRR